MLIKREKDEDEKSELDQMVITTEIDENISASERLRTY